jgi:putative two-component system response regulator
MLDFEDSMLINRPMRVATLSLEPTDLDPEAHELLSIGIEAISMFNAEQLIGYCASGQIDGVVLSTAQSFTIPLIQTIKSDPHTRVPILVLLGAEQLELEENMILYGADEVVTSPWNRRGLRARVERMCRKHLQGLGIEDQYAIMKSLTQTVEKHDPYTAHHVERLRFLSGHVAMQMGRSAREVAAIRAAGLLHDIGKVAIPGSILRKPTALNPEEWALMRLHPIHGAEIAINLPVGEDVAPMVRSHHERWDGTGYPDAIGATDIPLGGRIVAVVDAFDAMTSNRPYRSALTIDEARNRLERNAGSQFDPSVVHSLLSLSPAMLKKQFELATSQS